MSLVLPSAAVLCSPVAVLHKVLPDRNQVPQTIDLFALVRRYAYPIRSGQRFIPVHE